MAVDATTIAVVRGYLEQIADEMCVVQVNSAFSPIVSEMGDMANGIYGFDTGETVVQGRTGQPIFIAAMQAAVQSLLAHVGARQETIQPDDIFMFNDPYLGGTHLPDTKLAKPFTYGGRSYFLLASTGHWADIGGATPGSFGPKATEIFQEGIRIPPVRLVDGGRFNRDLHDLVLHNVRLPGPQAGDIQAQLNVLRVAEERLTVLFNRYGPDIILECAAELKRRSEAQMRSYLEELPDGTYTFEDYLDNDGVEDRPMRVALDMTVRGSDVHLDFSRSGPPAKGPVNAARHTTISACQVAMKHLFPDVPINAGCWVPFSYAIPESTFLGAVAPRPVGGYVEVASRVIDTVFGAIAQASPERAHGAAFNTGGTLVMAGTEARRGYFVATLPYGGGYGASAAGDGLIFGTHTIGSANFPSLEASEHNFPIRWRRFAIREGSGGAGAHVGGYGAIYDLELLAPATSTILGDRATKGPFGVLGGQAGAPNQVQVWVDGQLADVPLRSKDGPREAPAGARFVLCSPGGGGYGDPHERRPELVARDVRRGYISRERACEVFGVDPDAP
jgi:N-methylhydantoinase B